jgi:hypothetical protein
VPAVLAASVLSKQQQQQQQQQQELGLKSGPPEWFVFREVWGSAVQVACKSVMLFLLHGKWPSAAAQAAGGSAAAASVAEGAGDVGTAKQLAAEQCFRHLSVLLLHVMGVADRGAAAAAVAAAQQQLLLLQGCVKELCALIAAVSAAKFDCSVLQAVLLQLLTQLCGLIGQGTIAQQPPVAQHELSAVGETELPANAAAAVGLNSWECVMLPDGVANIGDLLRWVGQQLQRVPGQMKQLVGPGVVHVVEQQLATILKRQMTAEEVDAVEGVVLTG